jgi:hypothetical protein
MAVRTQTTQVLSEKQIASFEANVVARGVKLGNWWAQQVAEALSAQDSPEIKRDVIAVCLGEVRRWKPTQPLSSAGPTTVEAWKRLVEEWRRQQRDAE